MKRVRWPRNFCKKKRKRKATGTVLSIHASLGRQPAAKLSSHFSLSLFSFFSPFSFFSFKKRNKRKYSERAVYTCAPHSCASLRSQDYSSSSSFFLYTLRRSLSSFFVRLLYIRFLLDRTRPTNRPQRQDNSDYWFANKKKKKKTKNVTTI